MFAAPSNWACEHGSADPQNRDVDSTTSPVTRDSALSAADDSSFGFDDVATLGVSSSLLEAYLAAASKISRIAIGDTAVALNLKTYVAPSDLSQNEHIEGLPFGTRGGMLIHHTFPVDGEYSFQLALLRGTSEELYGRSREE